MANLTNNLINLAFEQAKINLGSTKNNPSVGCIIEKNGSVISSGCTSINGRPHAEFNALNKKKILRVLIYIQHWNPVLILEKHPHVQI